MTEENPPNGSGRQTSPVVGVDGGGTQTTIALYDAGQRPDLLTPLIRTSTEPAAVDPSHPERSVEQLEQAVRTAVKEADRTLPVHMLVAGLAGAGRDEVREDLQRRLQKTGVAKHVRLVTDARVAYYDAFEGEAGMILISGTGSIAYGQNDTGTTRRVGGWGPLLGDEGSGYDIALHGLRAILKAADGRGVDTKITDAVLETLDLQGVNDLVTWIRRAERSEIASCAKDVLRVASNEDEVAMEIAGSAVEQLRGHVRALRDRLGPWENSPGVAFHGGIIAPGQPLFEPVKDAVRTLGCAAQNKRIDPARGAVKLALHLIE